MTRNESMRWLGALPVMVLLVAILAQCAPAHAVESWHDAVIVPDTDFTDVLVEELTDAECMALNIYHEARGEPEFGQALVAQVTVDRVADRFYPSTVCDVVLEPAMFTWVRDGRSDKPHNTDAYRAAYLMAIEFLFMGRTADTPYAGQLLTYHGLGLPGWADMMPVLQYHGHIFNVRRATYVPVDA